MSSKTKQQKPKWFKGMIYTKSETVTNPFSGNSYELTGLEVSIYDFIIGCQMVFDKYDVLSKKQVDEFNKALTWFRVNNPEAYYVLLDQFSYPRFIARTQKVRAFRGMKDIRYKIERKLDRYNHLMELIRTLTGLTVLVLQLILLYTL